MIVPEAEFNEHGFATNNVKILIYEGKGSRRAVCRAVMYKGKYLMGYDVMLHDRGGGGGPGKNCRDQFDSLMDMKNDFRKFVISHYWNRDVTDREDLKLLQQIKKDIGQMELF